MGLVRIRRDGARLAFAAPPLLRSAERVLAIRPDWAALGDVKLSLVGPQPA